MKSVRITTYRNNGIKAEGGGFVVIGDNGQLPADVATRDWVIAQEFVSLDQLGEKLAEYVTKKNLTLILDEFWRKDELIRDDLYLKFIEGYVKAKYADDAGDAELWAGHLFGDYLNQAVKTDSDVIHNSLQSPDFVSKIAGWIISALGDSEFRDVIAKSFQTRNFSAGPLGAGVGILNQEELQTDKLLVRKLMFVLELVIQKIRHQGGILILSPASMKISRVVDGGSYWKCYFENDGGKLPNEFVIDDQARLQNFNGDIKYLWSKITAIGGDYIHLSKTDKDGEGIPSDGDDLVQLGNRTNADRQDAVLISSVNGEVGIITYFGINSFDLSGKEGSWFGKHGGKIGAVIRGEVHVEANSSGLTNLSEWGDAARDIQAAQAAAEEAKRQAREAQDFIDNVLPGDFASLQAQIDGQIESFFYNYTPTLSNVPASSWTTVADKDKHLNDTFTNTQTGASWRFTKNGSAYSWVEIADTATKKALQLAGQAQDTADSKRRVFVVTPVPPYEVGDLWAQGTGGDLARCKVSRVSGNHVSGDWEKASKYTDDTTANTAKSAAESANIAIGMMSDDNIISSFEKPALKKEWDAIISEKVLNDAQATRFGVDKTAYGTAYTALSTFIGTNLNTLTTDWSVTGTTLRANFKTYYDARTTLLNNISYNAKQQAAKAESDARAAQEKANSLEVTVGQQGTKISSLDGKYSAQASQITGLQTKMDAVPGKITQEVSGVIDWTEGKITETKEYADEQVNNVDLGTRNLITNRQNIITSGADYPGETTYASVLNEKGEREVTVTGVTVNANYRSYRYLQLAPSLSEKVYAGQYLFSYDYKTNHSGGYLELDWRTPALSFRKPLENTNGVWKRGFFLCDWTSKTTQDGNLFLAMVNNNAIGNYIAYRNLKLVRGNKGWNDSEAPEDVDARVKAAKDAAAIADGKAVKAQGDATALNTKLTGWAADNVISPLEKQAIKETQTSVLAEKNEIVAEAGKYGVSSSAFVTAWTNYNTQLTNHTKATPENITISAALATTQTAYSTAKVTIRQAIAEAARVYSNTVSQEKADAAKKAAIDAAALDATNKVDNIQIGGTNLLSVYDAKSIGYRAGSLKEGEGAETIFKCNTPGAWAILPISNPTMSIPVNTDFVISCDIRNTNNFGFEVTGTTSTPTLISLVKFVNTTSIWKRVSRVYNSGDKANIGGVNLYGVGDVRHIKIELGNKATDWSISSGDIQAEIDDVSKALGNLDTTVNGAFKDGVINEAETKAIAQNINILNAERKDVDARYNDVYGNSLLSGAIKDNLWSAKTAYNTGHDNLIASINTAISDKKISAAEKADVNTKFTAYGTAMAGFTTKINQCLQAIENENTRRKSLAQSWAGGKMLHADPTFLDGVNSITRYMNSPPAGHTVTLTRVAKITDSPISDSQYNLKVESVGVSSSTINGGFYFSDPTRANGIFICRFIAKIPAGYTISFATNSIGTGSLYYWATSNLGTGKFKEYIYVVECSATGTFSTTFYFYLSGAAGTTAAPLAWYLAYASSFDMTSGDNAMKLISDISSDNKLTPSEKQNVQRERNVIDSTKAQLVAKAAVYGVSSTTYTNQHTALINYITPLLADLSSTSNIVAGTFRRNFSDYYYHETLLRKQIGDKSKQLTQAAQEKADQSGRDAAAAATAAGNAQTSANTANGLLANWATDAKVNPSEKLQLKQQQANIQAEYTEISAQATRYNLKSDATWTAYNTAYTNANTALTTYTAASPEFITIVAATWNNIAAYYPKRQAVLDKIAVAAKTYADTVANNAVENLEIGGRNLFLDSGRLIKNGNYNIAIYTTTVDLVAGKKYTFVMRGTTTGGQRFIVHMNNGNYGAITFKANMTDEIVFGTFTATTPVAAYIRKLNIYNATSANCAANPATIKWAALYEGVVKPPSDWTPAPEDVEQDIEVAKSEVIAGINNESYKLTLYAKQTDLNAMDKVVKNAVSDITLLPSSIKLTVKSELIDPLSIKVTNAESSITQLKDRISLLVTSGDIDTGLTIKPNLIEITGQTVIKNLSGNTITFFGSGTDIFNINDGAFRVDKDGNGSFKGRIESSTGKIGPFDILESGLWSSHIFYNQTWGMLLSHEGLKMNMTTPDVTKYIHIGVGPTEGYPLLRLEGGNIEHVNGTFNTNKVHFGGKCTQLWGDGRNPVKLPLLCGVKHIGDVPNDRAVAVEFNEWLTNTNYMVFCTFLLNSGHGYNNNDFTYVITKRGANYFEVCIGKRTSDPNDVWLQYLVVGEG